MRTAANEQHQQFGLELRSLRQAKGMGLRQFARALSTSPSHICNLEYGRDVHASADLLCRMAEVLEVQPTQLLAKAGKLPPDMLLAFWEHPAIPPILSTIPEMSLQDAQTFCQQVVASLRISC